MVELDTPTYWARRRAHEERVDAWLDPIRERTRRGESHPVDDFLFTYYSFRPTALRRWNPGVGVAVCGAAVAEFAGRRGYECVDGRAHLDPAWLVRKLEQVRWTRQLLAATAGRSAKLGCFGLHEWAMVYQQPESDVRHAAFPLRLGARETNAVVESHRITCTHFDAFRFFTEPARSLNAVQPTRESQRDLDQPGCLHASMDLYKWAYKLAPAVSSELVADCFELAREIRQVDMAAAPYDLTYVGVEPIRIETPEGKHQYVAAQRRFIERAAPLRERLIDACDSMLDVGATASPSTQRSVEVDAERVSGRI
jgi:hypothetical protein